MPRFDLSRCHLENQADIRQARMRYWSLCWFREEMGERLRLSPPASSRPTRDPDQQLYFELERFLRRRIEAGSPTPVGTMVHGTGRTLL